VDWPEIRVPALSRKIQPARESSYLTSITSQFLTQRHLRCLSYRWTGLDWTGLDWTGLDWTGLDWTGLNWTGLDWTELDWTGLDWTGLDWTGLDWTGLDWTGLDWTGLDCLDLDYNAFLEIAPIENGTTGVALATFFTAARYTGTKA
jgi:hypothetical protein